MKTGTILRIKSGMTLSPELSAKLSALFPDYTLEIYTENRHLPSFYKERADILGSAFHFILDAYPPNAGHNATNITALKKYLEYSRQACDFNCSQIEDLQVSLAKYTARLVNALMDGWKWPKGHEQKEAFACLNEAEQYIVMQEGAKDIASVLPMAFGEETLYVLQWDKRLPPYSDFWLEELEKIKSLQTPQTPQWFRELSGPQQVFLSHMDATIDNKEALKRKLFDFLRKWYLQKARPDELLAAELQQIANDEQPFPQWYSALEKAEQEMLRHLALSGKNAEGITVALQEFNGQDLYLMANDLKQITALPLWYSLLSETQQSFLKYSLEKADSVREAVSFLPSRLRTLPAPANFRMHQLSVLNEKGEIVEQFKERYASSHIVSRDVLKLPDAVQLRHSLANLEAVIQYREKGKPFIIQTLISPAVLLDYIPFVPDRHLAKGLERSIKLSEFNDSSPIYINHPYNIAKLLDYTLPEEKSCKQLLKLAQQAFEADQPYKSLLGQYEQLLNSGFGTATFRDWSGRELFLSSYEHLLMVGLQGLSYGSCVSGKDRKSIEFIHTDAMLLYKMRYGRFPDFHDVQAPRQQFVDIVVDLYASLHAHQLAGQNAPGSNGIKTPANYWPADISDAIIQRMGQKMLYEDDRLATNNEVGRIGNPQIWNKCIKPRKSLTMLAAINIGESDCQRFIDALALIINERQRFKPGSYMQKFLTTTEIPRGISEVRELINRHCGSRNENDRTPRSSAIIITARICQVIARRPLEPGNRTPTTLQVYELLRSIIDNPGDIENIIDRLDELKLNAYKQNSVASNLPRSASEPSLTSPALTGM